MKLKTVQNGIFVLLLVLVTLAFFGLVRGFLMPLFWAAVLAVLSRRPYRWLRVKLKGRASLAALLTVLGVVLVVLLPLGLLGTAVVNEALGLYARVASGEVDVQQPLAEAERMLPQLTELLERVGVDLERLQASLAGTAGTLGQAVAEGALRVGQNALTFAVLFFVMLYVLFFFVRDGEAIVDGLIRSVPLGGRREQRLLGKFVEVTRATVKGTLVVGLVQGALGGVLFAIVGIGAAVFWGVVMAVLSLLPAVGTALVWLPTALYLLATGAVWQGVLLLVGGAVLIGLADNVLRPLLVGRDTRLPDWVILISTLGGIAVLGLTGVVVGPVVAALFLAVWQMFREEFGGRENVEAIKAAADQPEAVPPLPPQGSGPSAAPAVPLPDDDGQPAAAQPQR